MKRVAVDMAWLLAIMLMCCLGCGTITGTEQHGVWVEDGIEPTYAAQACAVWADMGVDCTPPVSRELALVVVNDTHEVGCVADANGTQWAGSGWWTYDGSAYHGWVAMHIGCYQDGQSYAPELAHEIGHALGLDHVTEPSAVMFPGSRAMVLAQADRDMFTASYARPVY